MGQGSGNQIPDWALPIAGIALSVVAGVLLVLAVRAAFRAGARLKKRIGNGIGLAGLALCAASLGGAMFFGWDMMDGPFFAFLGGFALAAVGGSLAGWTGGPPNLG